MDNQDKNFLEASEDVEIDELIDALREIFLLSEEEERILITKPEKIQQLTCVYKLLSGVSKGSGVRVTRVLNKPLKSMGYINVSATNLSITDTAKFVLAAKVVDNIEVYQKLDGTIEMNFTVHGITQEI